MKRLLLLLFYIPFFALSQHVYVLDDDNFSFTNDSYQYLIADNVNVRSLPSTESSIVANLSIGTRLRIIEQMPNRYVYNNISSPWYKVSFRLQDGKFEYGYVVGVFIAQAFVDDHSDILFLSGPSRYYPGIELKYQIRVAKRYRELHKLEYLPIKDPNEAAYYFEVSINSELDNYIITANFLVPRCGSQHNETTFFFDDNRLHYLRTFSDMDHKTLGFDNGRIQLYKWVIDNYDNDMGEPDYKKELIQEYIWDGRALRIY